MLKEYLISFRGRRRYVEVYWGDIPISNERCRKRKSEEATGRELLTAFAA